MLQTFRERNQTLNRVQSDSVCDRSVSVKTFVNWLCTSIQCGGPLPHDELSFPCSGAPPQQEAVLAVGVQGPQGEVGGYGVLYCLFLRGAVIALHN